MRKRLLRLGIGLLGALGAVAGNALGRGAVAEEVGGHTCTSPASCGAGQHGCRAICEFPEGTGCKCVIY